MIKLARKLRPSLLLVSLLPLGLGMVLLYQQTRQQLSEEIQHRLQAIANAKVQAVEHYVASKRQAITALAQTPTIETALLAYQAAFTQGGLQADAYRQVEDRYGRLLNAYREVFGYYDVFLIAPNGDVVYTAAKEADLGSNLWHGAHNNPLLRVTTHALTQLSSDFSDLVYYAPSSDITFFAAAPVMHQGNLAGVIALQLRKQDLFDIVEDYRELGRTGDIQLAMAQEHGALLVAPRRFNADAAFHERIAARPGDALPPLLSAVRGDSGVGIYAPPGQPSRLTSWRYLPSLRLGLEVHLASEEAFAPIAALQRQMLAAALVITLALLFLSRLLQRLAKAEQAARDKQAELRLIFDHTADGIISIDAQGIIVAANAAAEHIFGYRQEELIGHNVAMLMPEPHRSHHNDYLTRYRDGGEAKVLGLTRELQGRRKDGTLFPLDLSVREILHGGNLAFTALLRDTSHRKQSEARLKLLSLAVEQSPAMVYITDSRGIIEYVNQRFCRTTRMTPEELLGQPAQILQSQPHGARTIWETIQAGQIWQGQYHSQSKGQNDYWALALVAPILDADNRLSHVVAIAEDITDIKRTQHELMRAKELADAASRGKSAFLSRMSHELRTPLNAIIGFGQLMDNPDEPLTPSQRENVDEILSAGQHLLKMVNEVLEFSQLESGETSLTMEALPIDEILEESIHWVESLAESRGISVESRLQSCLGHEVWADRRRLEQCLSNLLSNGIKYNRPQGRLTVDCAIAHGSARIAVTDQGAGIPPEHQENLFQPFERFGMQHTESDGIGLAATKRYVELMNGSIDVVSAAGAGSTFTLILPLAVAEGAAKAQTPLD